MNSNDEPDYKRLFLAVFLAAALLIGWQAKVEWPRRQQLAQYEQVKEKAELQAKQAASASMPVKETDSEDNPALTREQRLALSPRLTIASDKLQGSIALKGARFDDLTLVKYRETTDPDSPAVTLFSPNGDAEAYFAQIGWVAGDNTKVPDQHTLWQADKKTLGANDSAQLRWDNGAGVTFILSISLDNDYMFGVTQRVENHSGHAVSVTPYAYINRAYTQPKQSVAILHEGPLGVMDGTLDEIKYKDLKEKGTQTFDDASGWIGITDKYWLAALIPQENYKATFSHYEKNNQDRYQVDYLDGTLNIENGASADYSTRLFAGAKVLSILDHYAAGDATHPPITLFDRAVDFGWLYLIDKPLLKLLTYFFALTGNFGVAILLMTVVVRSCLYPLANKSFKSMAQMRAVQPEMAKLRERHTGDQITLQKEMMALYKREKVNPASGCLPLLVQMPVFFALYKVLYVSIEMRQAPFFGWIKDLSVTDPSNLFTGFGLMPWDAPAWLHLGLLPILYCITMIVQMKQQPAPADPVQAKMMSFMPYFLLFIFAKMPAGLVLYWMWSNILSILQQRLITHRHDASKARQKAKAA